MENKNEENKREDKKSLEQNQSVIQKQAFDINLPDGSVVNTETLDEEQYKIATIMQRLQSQIEQLAPQVAEYETKVRHFDLEQKQLMDLLRSNGKPN